jgi:hypothetical protein
MNNTAQTGRNPEIPFSRRMTLHQIWKNLDQKFDPDLDSDPEADEDEDQTERESSENSN